MPISSCLPCGRYTTAFISWEGYNFEDGYVINEDVVREGLHQASLLSKDRSTDGVTYGDMLKRMFAGFEE